MAVTRTLLPADLPALEALLLRLGLEDRRTRFGGVVRDAGITAHCAAVAAAGRDARVIGVFEEGRLVAAAELWFDNAARPLAAQPECEVAVVVAAAQRGRGLGKRLLERTVLVARNRWARRLHMSCLLENRRMQQLARQFARELRFEDGSAEAEILLPYPSAYSLWAEAALDMAGFAASAWPRASAAAAQAGAGSSAWIGLPWLGLSRDGRHRGSYA